MEQEQSAGSGGDSLSGGSDCEFEEMHLPHIPGAAADVVAAAAAAGLIDAMQSDGTERADAGAVAAPGHLSVEAGAFHGGGSMDRSGDESDSSSSSSSSSSEGDAMENSAAVAAMLEVDSDDEATVEPVVAAAQVPAPPIPFARPSLAAALALHYTMVYECDRCAGQDQARAGACCCSTTRYRPLL